MTSKYPGRCQCGARVQAGQVIEYDRDASPRVRSCPACREPDPNEEAAAQLDPLQGVRLRVVHIRRAKGNWAVLMAEYVDGPGDVLSSAPVSLVDEHGNRRELSLVGKFTPVPHPGDLIEIYGSWERHPQYGWQINVAQGVPIVSASLGALRAFMAKLPNVGDRRAADICQAFGQDKDAIMHALEHEPEKLTTVKGITEKRAKEIQVAFRQAEGLRDTMIWMAGKGLTDAVSASAIELWGTAARQMLETNPYLLMLLPRVGFAKADEIALGKFRLSPKDPRRAAAAVIYLLEEEENQGHTWTDLYDLVGRPAVDGI